MPPHPYPYPAPPAQQPPNPVAGGVTLSDPGAVCESTAEGSSCQGGLVGGPRTPALPSRAGRGEPQWQLGRVGRPAVDQQDGGSGGRCHQEPSGATGVRIFGPGSVQLRLLKLPLMSRPRGPAAPARGPPSHPRASSHVLRPHIWCAICVPPPPA